MKLLYCPKCHDVVRILNKKGRRHCACGQSFGMSKDNMNIIIGGHGIPIGIADNTLQGAIRSRPIRGKGCNFGAFVIPANCKTVQYEKDTMKDNKMAKDVRNRLALIEE